MGGSGHYGRINNRLGTRDTTAFEADIAVNNQLHTKF